MNDRADRPWDAGLQPERTALAWRRTALALVVAAVVSGRLLTVTFGMGALVPSALGLVAASATLVLSQRRYRYVHEQLTASASYRIPLTDGRLIGLTALIIVVGACAGLAVVLVHSEVG